MMDDFESEYFIQTRKEIDTEKIERNKILHLMIIVFGGAYALLVNGLISNLDKLSQFTPIQIIIGSFCFSLPLLTFITSMVKARLIRKFQIADRWKTLYGMLESSKDLGLLKDEISLEAKVVQGLKGTKYLIEDKAVFIAMSVMTYFPLIAFLLYVFNKFHIVSSLIIGVFICVLHFFLSWLWLFRRRLLKL